MKFDSMKGLTLCKIDGLRQDSGEIRFTSNNGRQFRLFHYQNCCENVRVEEVIGDVEDLLNTPILLAEEIIQEQELEENLYGSGTWTFYKLSTIKGSVTIRWLGESNGYYSETVDFEEIV